MARPIRPTLLGAAMLMAALGFVGCSDNVVAPVAEPPALSPLSALPVTTTAAANPAQAPLPAPAELTDVLIRLADTSVPSAQKVALIQYATPDDTAALDRFGKAIADNGLAPLSFDANDLMWSANQDGHVLATVTINTAAHTKALTFPMEFTPLKDSWQLTRQTADQLLQLGQHRGGAPAPPAAPTPPR